MAVRCGRSGAGGGGELVELLRDGEGDQHARHYWGRSCAGCRCVRWVKTEHAYPNRTALMTDRQRLGEILAGGGWISQEQLEAALVSRPSTRRLGEHLLVLGLISEEDLYCALALQNHLPVGRPEPSSVSLAVTRALPAALARKWRVLPFRIAAGELYMAGSEIPGDQMRVEVRQFSSLEIRFHLVTPKDYADLVARYLG